MPLSETETAALGPGKIAGPSNAKLAPDATLMGWHLNSSRPLILTSGAPLRRMPTPVSKERRRGGEAVALGVDGIALLQRVAFGEEHEAGLAKASQHY
jgi:hypothetical protein